MQLSTTSQVQTQYHLMSLLMLKIWECHVFPHVADANVVNADWEVSITQSKIK